ncbi:MAG: pro-sigmaK processing inhibitor BofA family protein [Paenisporosarcina sp.]
MKLTLCVIGIILLLFLFLNKTSKLKVIEIFSIWWFRIAFAFVILFGIHVISSFFGFFVPVNIIFGLIIAALGLPGIMSILLISMVL